MLEFYLKNLLLSLFSWSHIVSIVDKPQVVLTEEKWQQEKVLTLISTQTKLGLMKGQGSLFLSESSHVCHGTFKSLSANKLFLVE
jgi:hypothetical protein